MGRKKNPPRHVDDNDPQEVKREKNRQAAERYRCKVKQEIKEWKNKCKDLETRNIQLTEKLKCAHSKLMELEKRTMCVHTQQMQTTARLVPYQSIPLTVSSNLAASTSVAPGAPQPSPSTTSSTASAASAASQCQSHHSNSATPIPNSRDSLSNWCLHKVIYDDPQWYIYQATDPSQFNHTADTPTSSRYCDISLEHLDISGEKKCSEAEQNCTSQMGNNLSPNNHSAQPLTNGQSTFPNMNSSVSTPVQGVQDIQGTGPGSAHIFVCNQAAISQDYHCDGGCNNRSYSH